MGQETSKFVQLAPSLTAIKDTLLAVSDSFNTVLMKLQGVFAQRFNKTRLTSLYSGGASSTGNFTIISLTVPSVTVGQSYRFRAFFHATKPLVSTNYLLMGIAIAGTNLIAYSEVTPTVAWSSASGIFTGEITITGVGTSGSISGSCFLDVFTSSTAHNQNVGIANNVTEDTSGAVVLTIIFQFSNSNASNLITCGNASIEQI